MRHPVLPIRSCNKAYNIGRHASVWPEGWNTGYWSRHFPTKRFTNLRKAVVDSHCNCMLLRNKTTLSAVCPKLRQYCFILRPMFVLEHYNPARRKCLQSNEIRFIGRCLVYPGLVWGCGMHAFYSWSNMNFISTSCGSWLWRKKGNGRRVRGDRSFLQNIEIRQRKIRNCKQHS